MNARAPLVGLTLLVLLAASGCSDDAQDPSGDAAVPGPDGIAVADAGELQNCDQGPPVVLGRGLRWVRDNPLFISGLTVSMDPPPPAAVHEYFDDFGANAVHLWEDGLPTEMDGWAAAGRPDFRFVSWVRYDGTSHDGGQVLGGYGPNPAGRIGYQIGDEPRTMDDLYAMEAGLNAARAADPEALLFVNFTLSTDVLNPLLDHYAQMDADVVSFDNYTYTNAAYPRWSIFREAGLTTGRPYWAYLNAYLAADETALPDETDMRWHAMLAMTFGYTGISWFLYQVAPPHSAEVTSTLYETPDDFSAPKTALWGYAAQLNRELAQLGRVLTQLTSTDVRYLSSLDYVHPLDVDPWTWGAGCDPWITGFANPAGETEDLFLGFFIDDAGERYVMLQNPHHASGVHPVRDTGPITLQVTFDFSAQTDPGFATHQLLHFNKLTGLVVPTPLTDLGQSRAALELTLAAGDAYLFKYDTGHPFALQPAP